MRPFYEIISSIMPNCREPIPWATELTIAILKYDITDPDAIAVFLAQIAVESAEMNRLEENLNYSAERLRAVWPRRFPTAEIAQRYARNPEALANFVYSNRMGNGPPESGDGWKYRGRGLKMVTGRNNYLAAATALGLPLISDPDLLLTKPAAAKSAAHFWAAHPQDLSIIADDLPDDDDEADFATITQAINGGQTGAAQRRMYWLRARKAMGLPT
jgi:putative chitinase